MGFGNIGTSEPENSNQSNKQNKQTHADSPANTPQKDANEATEKSPVANGINYPSDRPNKATAAGATESSTTSNDTDKPDDGDSQSASATTDQHNKDNAANDDPADAAKAANPPAQAADGRGKNASLKQKAISRSEKVSSELAADQMASLPTVGNAKILQIHPHGRKWLDSDDRQIARTREIDDIQQNTMGELDDTQQKRIAELREQERKDVEQTGRPPKTEGELKEENDQQDFPLLPVIDQINQLD